MVAMKISSSFAMMASGVPAGAKMTRQSPATKSIPSSRKVGTSGAMQCLSSAVTARICNSPARC